MSRGGYSSWTRRHALGRWLDTWHADAPSSRCATAPLSVSARRPDTSGSGLNFDLTAPILFRYFNVSRARFVRNVAEAAPLNNWLLIQPKVGVDPDKLFAVLQELGKSTMMEHESRHYGKGLWKLEPGELSELMLPKHACALLPSA